MQLLITKYLITSLLVVIISEVVRRSDRVGALLAALPMVTLMVLIWMWFEGQPEQKIANHAWYTFWYVLPTLPMFLAFPWLLGRIGFWGALGASAVITLVCFVPVAWAAKSVGVELL
ncbi:MAG: DUF3147 family protein [Pseudomonadales bacterium]|nr:DUF3147 family protein [Pseudomonadales bacterium]